MKHFYFTKEVVKHSKKYGCSDILCRIYEPRKEVPYVIGIVKYNTASTPGATAEVFQKLIELGYIPKKYYNSSKTDWCGAGYFYGKVTEKYGIWELY